MTQINGTKSSPRSIYESVNSKWAIIQTDSKHMSLFSIRVRRHFATHLVRVAKNALLVYTCGRILRTQQIAKGFEIHQRLYENNTYIINILYHWDKYAANSIKCGIAGEFCKLYILENKYMYIYKIQNIYSNFSNSQNSLI